MTPPQVAGEDETWRDRAVVLLSVLGVIWAVSLWGLFVQPELTRALAVVPRSSSGLVGVLGMPFAHGSIEHLLANTMPLLVFGALLLGRGVAYFLKVSLVVMVVGGLALWLLGRETAHIGASGVVFGQFGFLVVRGLCERRLSSIAITVFVVLAYGGAIFGVLPQGERVSWEAHLFGLLAGVGAARLAWAVECRRAASEARR